MLLTGTETAYAAFGNAYETPTSPYTPQHSFQDSSSTNPGPPTVQAPVKAPSFSFGSAQDGQNRLPELISGVISGGADSGDTGSTPIPEPENTRLIGSAAPSSTTLAMSWLSGQSMPSIMSLSVSLDRDDPRNATNSPQPGVTAQAGGTGTTGDTTGGTTGGTAGDTTQGGGQVIGGLSETYDVLLGMYEQTFEPGRSFLTSVPNGGRTRDGVWMEFPDNMKLAMELDGKTLTPKTGMWLTDEGSYTIRAVAPRITSTGESTGVFTFRILPPHTAGKEETGSEGAQRPLVEEFFSVSSNSGKTLVEYVFSNYKRFYANVSDGETVGSAVHFVLPPNVYCNIRHNGAAVVFQNNKNYDDPGDYVVTVSAPTMETTGARAITLYTTLSFTIDEGATNSQLRDEAGSAGAVPEGEVSSAEPTLITEALTQVSEGAQYRQYFSTGASFLSSVENGGVSQAPVRFEIPADMLYDLSRDGSAIGYDLSGEIIEPGRYVLNIYLSPANEDGSAYRSSLSFTIAEPQPQEQPQSHPAQTIPSDMRLPEQSYAGEAFHQSLSPDFYFTSNIPNGLVSRVTAQFSISGPAPRRMMLNGEEIPFAGDETISAPGNYQMVVTDPVTRQEFLFSFVILPQFARELAPFAPPAGYEIETALKNGEEIPFSPTGLPLDSDGDYVIQMTGEESYPPFTVDVTLDTTAPTLTLTGVEEGKATGAEVTFTSDDETAPVSILLNGEPIDYRGGALTQSGSYSVTVTDRAGNSSTYDFSIPFRLNRTALLFIVLIVLLLSGGAYYFLRLRKTAKV
jgi:hypothetical protein